VAAPWPATDSSFNPRPCARGDFHGAFGAAHDVLFQSAPLREGRPVLEVEWLPRLGFQSAPLREGRLAVSTILTGAPGPFQSAPLREGRPVAVRPAVIMGDSVSIRAPARGATFLFHEAANAEEL